MSAKPIVDEQLRALLTDVLRCPITGARVEPARDASGAIELVSTGAAADGTSDAAEGVGEAARGEAGGLAEKAAESAKPAARYAYPVLDGVAVLLPSRARKIVD